MGWATGSGLASSMVMTCLKIFKNKEDRYQFYRIMIHEFEVYDCDTLDEVLGIDKEFDRAYKDLNPDWENDES